ncbi:MAG: hypothetical protein FWC79_06475 [Oscillospiraceae bacterium]|nr:hypothetical protein [Oscillospiraceae bacterium]
MFVGEDRRIMMPLLKMIGENKTINFKMTLQDNAVLLVEVDACYETDNGIEMNEDGYEEFMACAVMILEVVFQEEDAEKKYSEGEFLEITYHNYPKKIEEVNKLDNM